MRRCFRQPVLQKVTGFLRLDWMTLLALCHVTMEVRQNRNRFVQLPQNVMLATLIWASTIEAQPCQNAMARDIWRDPSNHHKCEIYIDTTNQHILEL